MSDLVSTKVESFTIGSRTLVYDFDVLTMGQMKIAETIFEFCADLERNPARNVDEKIRLSADRDTKVLACILVERNAEGVVIPFSYEEPSKLPLLSVIAQMPARDVGRAGECVSDFFDRCGRTALRLLVQSAYEIKYVRAQLEGIQRTMNQVQQTISETNSPLESNASEGLNPTESSNTE